MSDSSGYLTNHPSPDPTGNLGQSTFSNPPATGPKSDVAREFADWQNQTAKECARRRSRPRGGMAAK